MCPLFLIGIIIVKAFIINKTKAILLLPICGLLLSCGQTNVEPTSMDGTCSEWNLGNLSGHFGIMDWDIRLSTYEIIEFRDL